MREVVQRVCIERSRRDVFALISDPDRYPEFFMGLTRWSLLSQQAGWDARYRVLMKVGSIEAGGIVRVTRWEEPDVIEWDSEQGIEQRGAWRLRDVPAGTELSLEILFDLSGGPVGRLVERMAGRIVARNVWASLMAARRILELEA